MGSISMGLTPKSQEEENKERQVSTVSEAKLKKINARREKSEERKNERADKLAARKGYEGPDARKKAKDLMSKRKEARKTYLRNFASQLARGEQATPRTGFGEEGNPNIETRLAQRERIIRDEADQIKGALNNATEEKNKYMSNIGSMFFKVEDSTPITYMQKEYRKKRGY